MKLKYIITALALLLPFQVPQAATLSLETVIEQALQNSPQTARILSDVADAEAEAFEIETPDNPMAEINITSFKDGNDNRTAEIELEQPLRLSNFGSRGNYAEALRRTASVEQKAQMLELIHTITRGYASYWALQEQEKILATNVDYANRKQRLVANAAKEGRVDASDAKIFKAEALRLEEQLRVIRARKASGAANLLRMAGMDQTSFDAERPISPEIPDLSYLTGVAGNEGSIRSLLEARKALAERRYAVARQDASFPEFAPRAVIKQGFDTDNTTVLLGVSIALPIWDRNNAEVSRAVAERRLAQSNLNALNEQNFANVLAAAYEQAKATQISASTYRNKILPAWNEVESITDKKFENGQASILDLFQMRERMVSVQSEALQTYLNSIEARIELESLIGQSLNDVRLTDIKE